VSRVTEIADADILNGTQIKWLWDSLSSTPQGEHCWTKSYAMSWGQVDYIQWVWCL